jgi:hypothetical protein
MVAVLAELPDRDVQPRPAPMSITASAGRQVNSLTANLVRGGFSMVTRTSAWPSRG